MGSEKGLISKGRYELKFRGTECLNCGHPLDLGDKYCPNCSQANSVKKLTLRDYFEEFLCELINYDSKLLRTFYTMMVKPGTITKDFINGKRISYTNPFRFLLSLAFLYLLLFSFDSDFQRLDDELNLEEKIKTEGDFNFSYNEDGIQIDSSGNRKKIKDFIPIDSLEKNDPVVAKNLSHLDTLDAFISKNIREEQKRDSFMLESPKKYFAKLKADKEDNFSNQMEFYITMLRNDSIVSFEEAQQKFEVEDNLKSQMAFNTSQSVLRALAQPGSWMNDTIAKLPFVVFFFLPAFTIFIYLVYIRKNYTYTDHLIFSFHNQSLLFILLILSWITDTIFGISTAGLAIVLFAVYLFQAMRKFYGQGIFKTLLKYVFLNTVFMFLAIVTIVVLSVGTFITY